MDITYKILILLAGIIFGYLIGSLSFSLIIGKNFYQKDVRHYGSKNAGGT
ncbi:MAG TPA: glycerol-3-phosphate acyltransferase, partial [Bacilli bacterium]|nr:glycerol-3-phosphate acyltransferase [Bacilli bacterium]